MLFLVEPLVDDFLNICSLSREGVKCNSSMAVRQVTGVPGRCEEEEEEEKEEEEKETLTWVSSIRHITSHPSHPSHSVSAAFCFQPIATPDSFSFTHRPPSTSSKCSTKPLA
jgi:hypothetical protein